VYGLFILGLELPPRLRQGPRGILALARDGFQALPAFTCLILAGNHLNPPPTAYIRPWHRVVDLTLLIDTNHVWLNIILISAMVGAIGWTLARGWLRLPARLILPLILCALIFVAIPDSILGTAYVAWRTMLAAVIVAIAALSPAPGRPDGRIVTALLMLALGVTLINSVLFALNAQRTADEKQAFLRAIAPMPYGARLFWAHSGGTQHALIAGTAGAYHVGTAGAGVPRPAFFGAGQFADLPARDRRRFSCARTEFRGLCRHVRLCAAGRIGRSPDRGPASPVAPDPVERGGRFPVVCSEEKPAPQDASAFRHAGRGIPHARRLAGGRILSTA